MNALYLNSIHLCIHLRIFKIQAYVSERHLKSLKMMMLKMFMPSVPKMPGGDDGEKKEESAESREEAKEQVGDDACADANAEADYRGGQRNRFFVVVS